MSRIKWLFFDIGYTLINEDDVWKNRVHEQLGLPRADGAKEMNESQMLQFICDSTAAYRSKYKEIIGSLGYFEFAKYKSEYEKLYPDVPRILKKLKKCYKLGILANQTAGLRERLSAYGIADCFDLVISSYDVQLEKPDPEIFRLAIEKSGCKASECVMIGDRIDNDIAPAKALGMRTVRILQGSAAGQKPRREEERPDCTVLSLNDLLKAGVFRFRRL